MMKRLTLFFMCLLCWASSPAWGGCDSSFLLAPRPLQHIGVGVPRADDVAFSNDKKKATLIYHLKKQADPDCDAEEQSCEVVDDKKVTLDVYCDEGNQWHHSDEFQCVPICGQSCGDIDC